jgi:hypothetical protein
VNVQLIRGLLVVLVLCNCYMCMLHDVHMRVVLGGRVKRPVLAADSRLLWRVNSVRRVPTQLLLAAVHDTVVAAAAIHQWQVGHKS